MAGAAPVEVRGLVKRYGDLVAVGGVDLTVEPGDVYGYLGPNGAGKTTSLRMMLGLIRPSAGQVRLFGRDPQAAVKALEGGAGFVEAPGFSPYLSGAERAFRVVAITAGALVFVLLGAIAVFLIVKGIPALRQDKTSFWTTQEWSPGTLTFGIAATLFGTALTAVLALAMAVPVAIGV